MRLLRAFNGLLRVMNEANMSCREPRHPFSRPQETPKKKCSF